MKNSFKLRNLSIAALVGLAGLGATNSAQANETPITPTLGDDASYTLTEISTPTDNSITLYKYDNTGITEAINYEISMKQVNFGNLNGSSNINYNWNMADSYPYFSFSENNDLSTPNDITYSYDTDSYSKDSYLDITPTLSKAALNGGTSQQEEIYGGTVISNTDVNSSIKYENILFKGVKSTIQVTGSASYGRFYLNGGIITNLGKIEYLKGDFIANDLNFKDSRTVRDGYPYGGLCGVVMYNAGEIGDIEADFISNTFTHTKSSSRISSSYAGGAIYNVGTIRNLKGNYINNGKKTDGSPAGNLDGGAIYNRGGIENISGNFVGNSASLGAAISNHNPGVIGTITANFIGNYSSGTYGSVIDNSGSIGNINGDFIGNSNTVIDNSGTMGDINGDFVNNITLGNGDGAIRNSGTIGDLNGNYLYNYVESWNSAYGAVITNSGLMGDIKGIFQNNYVSSPRDNHWGAYGGVLYNDSGVIDNITGDFINNYALATESGYALGGAIYNNGIIGASDVDNLVYAHQYDITDNDGNILRTLYWTDDKYTESDIEKSANTVYFIDSYVSKVTEEEFLSWFDYATTIDEAIQEQYELWDGSYIEGIPEQYILDGGIINSSFINNYVKSVSGEAQGGAIWTNKDLNIVVKDGYTSIISGNYVEDKNGKRPEAIRVTNTIPDSTYVGYYPINSTTTKKDVYKNNIPTAAPTTLSFINNTDGKTVIDDQIVGGTEHIDGLYYTLDGEKQYVEFNEEDQTYHDIETPEAVVFNSKLNITGDGTGLVQLNNDVINMDITLDNSTLHLGARDNVLDNNNLTLNSGTLSMINNQAGVSALSSLTVTGDTNVLVDVDLKNQTMDRFTASEYGSHSGNLNVTGMNLLSDANEPITEIMFAEQGLKDNVTYGGAELPNKEYQTTLYTPIYKYNASYDNREDAGYFVFSRGDKIPVAGGGSSTTGNPSDAFNPAILGSSTSATVGALGTMNQAFNYAFQHSADHMNIPYLERISMRDRNKYALSITGDATDMGRFSPLYQPSQEEASVWVKPYATFETVGLKNGPKVHNNTYGTLIGFDTQIQSLRRGWDRVFTGYIGYNGASQHYSGIDSTQNGGLLGGTMTLYKGNFFNATTVSVGASVANNQTMYGNEDFAMLLSGIGNKTGYNFEFKEGKLILQPSMLMSYTFVNTFDYTNAAGVRIDNKPLHALQLAPGVKVIGNLKNGWQPYASVQMVWNLMGESNATANGVKLPEMSIKPYVQYGVGVQKRIKDHFTAYGQAMVQNGGRNGVSLTAGFRWALGHDNCKYEKTQRHPEVKTEGSLTSKEILRSAQNDRGKYIDNKTSSLDVGGVMPRAAEHKKILKQMTPEQKMAHGGKYMNTSRTAKTGSLRQY